MSNENSIIREFNHFSFDPFDNDYEGEEVYDLDFFGKEKDMDAAADRWSQNISKRPRAGFAVTERKMERTDSDPMDTEGSFINFDW